VRSSALPKVHFEEDLLDREVALGLCMMRREYLLGFTLELKRLGA